MVSPRPSSRQFILGAMLAALVGAGMAPASAAAFRPAVAVLLLQNLSPYGGRLLGRRAADQLALDLGATGLWRVLDRAQTDRACQQRELRPPYAGGYMQEVGFALGADLIFSGTLQSVEISAAAGRVRVALYAEAIDQVSGQVVLGTRQTAEVTRDAKRPEPTDVLVSQALASACAAVAKLSAAGPQVQAQIDDPRDGKSVTLKLPAETTLATGQRLLLYRAVPEGAGHVPGKLLAALMVSRASAGSCEAQVLAHSGDIHSGDLAFTVGQASPREAAPRPAP